MSFFLFFVLGFLLPPARAHTHTHTQAQRFDVIRQLMDDADLRTIVKLIDERLAGEPDVAVVRATYAA
jgi:hypothetical protein